MKTNGEFWKTEEQRKDRFNDFCLKRECKSCPCLCLEVKVDYTTCFFKWLEQEFQCFDTTQPPRAIPVNKED